MSRKNSTKDFSFEACIGEGSYSKVYNAVSIHNHKTYAIKVLNKNHIVKEKKIKYVNIEKNTLNKLGHHPGIVTLHYTFQDAESLYFVIDYARNGELLGLIRKWGSLSEPVSRYYTTQLVDAVDFIHSKGIIHRDLKPENILLNHDYKLMITDFGAAKILEGEDTTAVEETKKEFSDSRAGSFVGTAEYVSPELLKYNRCGFECDYWAIGCIVYQLITGYPPFKGNTEYLTFEKIIKLDYKFPDYYIPHKIKHLVANLLVLDPDSRFDLDHIKAHDWFRDVSWADKESIWKKRPPKLDSYNPKAYTKKYPSPRFAPAATNGVPDRVLQKQLAAPMVTQQAMNKALTQRLIIKNHELSTQQRNASSAASAAARANLAAQSPKRLPRLETADIKPAVRGRSSTAPQQQARPQARSPRTPTSAPASAPVLAPAVVPAVAPTVSNGTRAHGDGPQAFYAQPQKLSTPPQPPNGSMSPSSTMSTVGNLMKKPFRSSAAAPVQAAPAQAPPQAPRPLSQSEEIDLGALSSVADIPLLPDEYVLKADSVFKSESPVPVSPHGDDSLDDTVLNRLIDENYETLNQDSRSSLLVITSLGRLLIYEFAQEQRASSSITSLDPRILKSRRYKETKLIVVNLTNKHVSMYEFDGVFIIKDANLPNIIFLNPADDVADAAATATATATATAPRGQKSPPFADTECAPNIRINPGVSWIDTLLRAKELLKASPVRAARWDSPSSEMSSPEKETIPVSPVETGMSGLSLASAPALALAAAAHSPPPQSAQQRLQRPQKARAVSSTKPAGAPAPVQSRSSSSGSLPYHYTQQQKSHPPAHQSSFTFLAQAKQNKFASAAAAASFKK